MAVTPRLKSLFTQVVRLRRELAKRIAEEEDKWIAVLTVSDLEILASPAESERKAFLLAMLESDEYATPFDLKLALYPDEIKPVITPAVVQPAQPVIPEVQPIPEVQAPIIETTVKPVTPAGLIKARFIGALAPGSLTVNDAIAGQRPLNRDEIFLFEQSYFNRLRSIWPASWWTIES